MTQGIQEQIGALPAIEAKLHLFQIGSQMLGAQSVPRAHDAALEQREGGFDGIGVNVSHDIAPCCVIDGLVILASSFPHGGNVCDVVIGENDFYIFTDILADIFCKSARLCVVRVEEAEIAVALADSN